MNKEDKAEKVEFIDPITKPLGDLGRFQLFICLMVFVSKFPTGWVTLSTVFLTPPVNATCANPVDVDVCNETCTEVHYDRSVFKETVIMEWNLICDRNWLASLSQTIVMFGVMLGGIFCGIFADKYGRRAVFVLICTLQLIFGVLVSGAFTFWIFCVLRFLTAFFTGGMMVVSFVIIMEIVGKSKREVMGVLYQIPFNMGHATLPLFAYFLRSWRWYHFGFSICSVFYLSYWCVIPESPRWLLTTGNVDRSVAILEKGAKCNHRPTEAIRGELEAAHQRLLATSPQKKATMLDLFRHRNLCVKTLAMAFNWLSVCMVYYGVAQYITKFGGNIFTNVAIGAWLGVPGTIICVPMTKYLGRKITLFTSNALSAVSLLCLAFMPNESIYSIVLATIGLFGASVTFPNVYLYGGELFPTVVRNSGVGFCSFIGRVGSMVAPFVSQASSVGMWIPAVIFGMTSLIAALAVLLLPETRGQLLPETIEDGERFGKKESAL